jgi:hypothetical protein
MPFTPSFTARPPVLSGLQPRQFHQHRQSCQHRQSRQHRQSLSTPAPPVTPAPSVTPASPAPGPYGVDAAFMSLGLHGSGIDIVRTGGGYVPPVTGVCQERLGNGEAAGDTWRRGRLAHGQHSLNGIVSRRHRGLVAGMDALLSFLAGGQVSGFWRGAPGSGPAPARCCVGARARRRSPGSARPAGPGSVPGSVPGGRPAAARPTGRFPR